MYKLNRMIFTVILSVFLSLPAMAAAEQVIGKITKLKGQVVVFRGSSGIGISAVNGMDLQQNDKIKTKAKAYLRFKLTDGSIMTLGQKAEITLDTYAYNPKKKKRVAFFSAVAGKLRIFANKMLNYRDNRFQIKTQTAVAGVRGTVYMVWVKSPKETKIVCFDGEVEVASVMDPDEYVILTKNILTSVRKDKAPTQPVLINEKEYKKFKSGFDGNIKPVDKETGFKDKGGGEGGDDNREPSDPGRFDDQPPVIPPPPPEEDFRVPEEPYIPPPLPSEPEVKKLPGMPGHP